MNNVQKFYEKPGLYGTAPDPLHSPRFNAIQNRLNKTLRLIAAQQPKAVLDIGCGDGFFSQSIHEMTGARVSGVDISIEAAELAREKGVDARQCDLNTGICFEASSFDLVVCTEVIEHVFDPDFLLDEIWRILSPGGCLVLSTPNLAAWYNRVLLLLGIQPIFTDTSTRKNYGRALKVLGQGGQPVGHLHLYTANALKEILLDHHFTIASFKAMPFLPFPVVRQVDQFLGLVPALGSDFLVLAKKSS
jgi:methionine biosynthesis protein MetW